MFNVNGWEMALIVVAFLLLFGPEKLPEVAMQLGKFVRELREASASATAEITRELQRAAAENPEAASDIRSIGDQARRFLQNTSDAVHNTVTQAYQETGAAVTAATVAANAAAAGAVQPWGAAEASGSEIGDPASEDRKDANAAAPDFSVHADSAIPDAAAPEDPEVAAILADVRRQVDAAGPDETQA